MGSTRNPHRSLGSVAVGTGWLIVAGLSINAAWLIAVGQSVQSQPTLSTAGAPVAAMTPYTVTLQETNKLPTGDERVEGTLTMALRSDAAFVVRYEHVAPSRVVIQRVIELPTGVTVVVDDVGERRSSTYGLVPITPRARMAGTQGCIRNNLGDLIVPGQILDGQESVAGQKTIKVRSGETTFWYARDLGCAQIKETTRLPSGVVNEKHATLVIPGEPDEAFFHVPDRYKEVPPSVLHGMDPQSAEALRMDRRYFERRPPR